MLTPDQIREIKFEIDELKSFQKLALNIDLDSKTLSLYTAIENLFEKQEELGANKKALLFTESKLTQEYLKYFLENNVY